MPPFGLLARENGRNVFGRRWAERGIHLCIIGRCRQRRRYSHLLTGGDIGDAMARGAVVNA